MVYKTMWIPVSSFTKLFRAAKPTSEPCGPISSTSTAQRAIVQSKKSAFFGALLGAVTMAVFSVITNYYVVYPVYTAFMPMETIMGMYQAILPSVENLWQALVIFNMPFTFIKGMINVVMAMWIYKPLSPLLKGRK